MTALNTDQALAPLFASLVGGGAQTLGQPFLPNSNSTGIPGGPPQPAPSQGPPPVPAWAAAPLAQQQAQSTAASYNPVSRPAGNYDTGGLPAVNQSLAQQAVADAHRQDYATLHPDFARRFLGKFSYKNDLPPLINSIAGQSNLALPDWQIAKDDAPVASVGSVDSMTPEKIAAMPPGPVRDALERRMQALTVSGKSDKGDFADYVDGTPATPVNRELAMQTERDQHLDRIARRAALPHDSMAREDKRYMGAKEFDAIHDAAEQKRSILAQSILQAQSGPFGMSKEEYFMNPQAGEAAMRAWSDQQKVAGEQRIAGEHNATQERIADKHEKAENERYQGAQKEALALKRRDEVLATKVPWLQAEYAKEGDRTPRGKALKQALDFLANGGDPDAVQLEGFGGPAAQSAPQPGHAAAMPNKPIVTVPQPPPPESWGDWLQRGAHNLKTLIQALETGGVA